MDRRLWIMTAIAAFVLSVASTFMGIQSEVIADRAARIQFACRQPEVADVRATRAQSVADSTSTQLPRTHTTAQPDRVNLAGF